MMRILINTIKEVREDILHNKDMKRRNTTKILIFPEVLPTEVLQKDTRMKEEMMAEEETEDLLNLLDTDTLATYVIMDKD